MIKVHREQTSFIKLSFEVAKHLLGITARMKEEENLHI